MNVRTEVEIEVKSCGHVHGMGAQVGGVALAEAERSVVCEAVALTAAVLAALEHTQERWKEIPMVFRVAVEIEAPERTLRLWQDVHTDRDNAVAHCAENAGRMAAHLKTLLEDDALRARVLAAPKGGG